MVHHTQDGTVVKVYICLRSNKNFKTNIIKLNLFNKQTTYCFT